MNTLPQEFKIHRDRREDIPSAVRLFREFHSESGMVRPFDNARIYGVVSGLVGDGRAALFMAKVGDRPSGMIACRCGVNEFTGEVISEEVVFFVRQEFRTGETSSALFEAFESWSMDNGAKLIRVTTQPGLRPKATAKWFARRGYQSGEASFTKEVKT